MNSSQGLDSLIQKFFEWQGAAPLAIFISAAIAVLALINARDLSRRKNSIDLLFNTKHDEKFIQGIDEIRLVHEAEDRKIEVYAENGKREDATTKKVRYVLNFLEHIAIGIDYSIYHEGIIETTIRSMLINSYKNAKPYIDRRRALGTPKACAELERLVRKWEAPRWKRILRLY